MFYVYIKFKQMILPFTNSVETQMDKGHNNSSEMFLPPLNSKKQYHACHGLVSKKKKRAKTQCYISNRSALVRATQKYPKRNF